MASNFRWIGKTEDGSQIILKKFNQDFLIPSYATKEWIENNKDIVRSGAALDTETTGANKYTDKIIELGIRFFLFNKVTGEIVSILDSFEGQEDPGFQLDPKIIQLTGLTNEDLKNKKIDWQFVDSLLEKVDLIIAHNAAFDRPFLEKYSEVAKIKPWACSAKQINWYENGFSTGKLELLSIWHGFFVDAHRALTDADALLHLLSFKSPTKNTPYMLELLTNARRPMLKIFVVGAPYDSKDLLRARSYYWDPERKSWAKLIYKDESESEIAWLEEFIYKSRFRGEVLEIPITLNFK
jgi:DNA polymerase-3 subunit epsilon